jgi:hypothetical protein
MLTLLLPLKSKSVNEHNANFSDTIQDRESSVLDRPYVVISVCSAFSV